MRTWISAACALALVACFGPSEASGTLTKNESGLTTTASPDDCAKVGGDPNHPGVELLRAGKILLRVEPDALLGDQIVVAGRQPNQPEQLTSSACSTWTFDAHFNGVSEDYDSEIDGKIDAFCTLPSGGTLEVHTTFANCL